MIQVTPIANPQDMAKAFDIRRIVFVIEQACPPDEEYDEHEASSVAAIAMASHRTQPLACRLRIFRSG